MQAIQLSSFGGPEVLEPVTLPDPEPEQGEVLVRMHAVGVAKPDMLMRSGKYRWAPPLPAILGNEMSGHIEALGPGVDDLAVGQPVLVWGYEQGCYTELGAFARHRIQPLPESVDMDAAVAIPNYVVSFALLHELTARPARSVYVNGAAGGIGTAVIQLARVAGMSVIAGAGSADRAAFAKKCGADHVIDYSSENAPDRLIELTGGEGVDLILDQLIGPKFTDNLKALATLGTIISFNALGGLPEEDLFAAMRSHLPKSPGVRCFSFHSFDKDEAARVRIMDQVLPMFASRDVAPPIHEKLPLAQARRAHEMLDGRKILGKLLLVPN